MVKTIGIYARVVGYYSQINNWNPGKRREFADRSYFLSIRNTK